MKLKLFINTNKFLTILLTLPSIVGLMAVLSILIASLAVQFLYGESPCPLCLLQRAAFVSVGLALFMNLRYGNKIAHWALVMLSAIAGIAVSIRQILLHVSDSIGYGSPVAGLHLYTWCFIGYALAIIGSAIVLLICAASSEKI